MPPNIVRVLQIMQGRMHSAHPLEVKKPENKLLVVQGLQDTLRLYQLMDIYKKNDPEEMLIMALTVEDMPMNVEHFRMAIDAVTFHRLELQYKNGAME